jgi:hypothetical protein
MEKEKRQVLKIPASLNKEIEEECAKIGVYRNRYIFIKQLLEQYKESKNLDSVSNRLKYLEDRSKSLDVRLSVQANMVADVAKKETEIVGRLEKLEKLLVKTHLVRAGEESSECNNDGDDTENMVSLG